MRWNNNFNSTTIIGGDGEETNAITNTIEINDNDNDHYVKVEVDGNGDGDGEED